MNIVLIGMPGSGKSTCGVLVAKALCKSFTDTDLLIQSAEGMPLQEIIDKKGNNSFAATEEKILCNLRTDNSVIATGGSAVYYPAAMDNLKNNALTVYIKISYGEMLRRIRNISTRGIVLKDGETLEEMFSRREILYTEYADITVDCNGKDIEDTVREICEIYNNPKI